MLAAFVLAEVALGVAASFAAEVPSGTATAATAATAAAPAKPPAEVPHRFEQRVWQPPAGVSQLPLWPRQAPDMDGMPQRPETVEIAMTPEALEGDTSVAIHDVSVPTMTVYPPKGRNIRAAILVFPGGGFQALAFTLEGTEVCGWIVAHGITCVLVKYRVPKSNHHWDSDCKCSVTPKVPRALQDAQRAIRLVRSKAKSLDVDPRRIGVMGFSAGGYLVAQTSNILEPSYARVDAVDAVSSRPDFAIAFFPGHICRRGGKLDPGLRVTKQAPPTFLLQAWDDPVDDICNSTMYARALDQAGVPAEVHLFARGGHAFALRPTGHPVSGWPRLVDDWLKEIGIL